MSRKFQGSTFSVSRVPNPWGGWAACEILLFLLHCVYSYSTQSSMAYIINWLTILYISFILIGNHFIWQWFVWPGIKIQPRFWPLHGLILAYSGLFQQKEEHSQVMWPVACEWEKERKGEWPRYLRIWKGTKGRLGTVTQVLKINFFTL